jgi:hypothetical protein
VIVHSQTAVTAVPANHATVAGRWLLLGVGGLSVLLVAFPLVSLLLYWRRGRREDGPRLGRLVAWPPGRGVTMERGLATARPAAVKRRCETCGKKVSVIGGKLGKRFRCPRCGTVQTIGPPVLIATRLARFA